MKKRTHKKSPSCSSFTLCLGHIPESFTNLDNEILFFLYGYSKMPKGLGCAGFSFNKYVYTAPPFSSFIFLFKNKYLINSNIFIWRMILNGAWWCIWTAPNIEQWMNECLLMRWIYFQTWVSNTSYVPTKNIKNKIGKNTAYITVHTTN